MTQTFNSTSLPSSWTQSNSCNSTSTNASWKMTTSNPGYGASGYTDNTGTTGSYAMWVDGSSPYPCNVSITTDSIDVSTLTNPSIEFYWFRNNTYSSSYPGGNKLYVDVFDGQTYHTVWVGDSDSAGFRKVQVDISCLTLNNDIALRFTVEKQNGTVSFYTDIVVDDIKVQELPTGFSNCAAPTSLTVDTVSGTSTTANVSLGCNSNATTTLIYGLAGFNPSTGGSTATVSSGTATLSSLVGSSIYEVYAVTACSSTSYSDTLGPITFVTPCGAVTTPYSEDFDAGSTGTSSSPNLPNCWEYYRGGSTYAYSVYQYVYGYISNSSSNSLRSYKTSSSTYVGDTAMSMTPVIQGLDSATKMLEFYGRKGYTSYPGELIVGVTNANGDAS